MQTRPSGCAARLRCLGLPAACFLRCASPESAASQQSPRRWQVHRCSRRSCLVRSRPRSMLLPDPSVNKAGPGPRPHHAKQLSGASPRQFRRPVDISRSGCGAGIKAVRGEPKLTSGARGPSASMSEGTSRSSDQLKATCQRTRSPATVSAQILPAEREACARHTSSARQPLIDCRSPGGHRDCRGRSVDC